VAGYSGTPLAKKLGIKPDARLAVLDAEVRASVPLYEETRARAEAVAKQERPPRVSPTTKGLPPIR